MNREVNSDRVRQKDRRQTFLPRGLVNAKPSSRTVFQSVAPDVQGTVRSNRVDSKWRCG